MATSSTKLKNKTPAKQYWHKNTKARSTVSGNQVSINDSKKWRMVVMYAQGKSNKEVAAVANVNERWVREFIGSLVEDLGTSKEMKVAYSKGKAQAVSSYSNQYGTTVAGAPPKAMIEANPELLNEPFRSLLSDPGATELNEVEVRFCWSYVASNSYEEALRASGLDIGLYKASKEKNGKIKFTKLECYKDLSSLRIAHMKSRPDIAKFIAQVREEAIFNVQIDKDFLQKELMIQVDELKSYGSLEGKKLLRDFLQMIGRTFGGFTDKVQVDNIDHAAVMKALADKASATETIDEAIKRKQAEAEAERIGSENQETLAKVVH